MTDAARAFFDAIARRYDRAYAPDSRSTRERVAKIAAYFAPRARILDLGVGTGRELSVLQDLGFRPTGVDVSKEMLALCARRARPIPLVEADFWRPLPVEDGAFDGVLALHGTLAHPPDVAAYVALGAEIARVLGPEGVFAAEVPAHAWLERLPVDAALTADDRRVRRTSADECAYDDLVTGASITAFIPENSRWPALFAPALEVRVEPLDEDTIALVGRAARAKAIEAT
jgi:SAM-dependent methyltransferase